MLFDGKAIQLKPLDKGLVELHFDLKNESVNKFGRVTFTELGQVLDIIEADDTVTGVISRSGQAAWEQTKAHPQVQAVIHRINQ